MTYPFIYSVQTHFHECIPFEKKTNTMEFICFMSLAFYVYFTVLLNIQIHVYIYSFKVVLLCCYVLVPCSIKTKANRSKNSFLLLVKKVLKMNIFVFTKKTYILAKQSCDTISLQCPFLTNRLFSCKYAIYFNLR